LRNWGLVSLLWLQRVKVLKGLRNKTHENYSGHCIIYPIYLSRSPNTPDRFQFQRMPKHHQQVFTFPSCYMARFLTHVTWAGIEEWGENNCDRRRATGLLRGSGPFHNTLCSRLVSSNRSHKTKPDQTISRRYKEGFPLHHKQLWVSLLSSCIRSISAVFKIFLPVTLSFSILFPFPPPLCLSCLKRWIGGISTCPCQDFATRGRGSRRPLILTGYTACRPCSCGGAERFCTPALPPLSRPGSWVRSPSFPRLQETWVRERWHNVGIHF